MPAPEVKKLVSKHVPAIADAVSCWRGSRVSTSNDCGECVPCWCGELPWKQTNYRRALLYFRLQEPVLDKGGSRRQDGHQCNGCLVHRTRPLAVCG